MSYQLLCEMVEQDNDLVKVAEKFLTKYPNPTDKTLHTFCESKGIDVHQFESAVYSLASKFINEFKNAGRANEKGITEDDVDANELAMGIKVEFEHTTCRKMAFRISLDHLAEIPDYYTRLAKMEGDAGVEH